jgi:hypothetical protein
VEGFVLVLREEQVIISDAAQDDHACCNTTLSSERIEAFVGARLKQSIQSAFSLSTIASPSPAG